MASFALKRAMEAKEAKGAVTHLYRGAPLVRSWSKYKETIKEWTLCGVHQTGDERSAPVTEDHERVTCQYCLDLMR